MAKTAGFEQALIQKQCARVSWRHTIAQIFVGIFIMPMTATAFAGTTSGENLPFESTLDMLQKSISGPVLTSMSIIMVAVTCVMLAFGVWGDGFKKIINIVLWLSIAFAAVSFLNHMFGAGAVF